MSERRVPAGLNVAEVDRLVELVRSEKELAARIDRLSSHFIGRPYVAGSLGGGPEMQEAFTATLEGFDCVTYIETVLALAMSNSLDQFITRLREIRYEGGEVDWHKRNHYMLGWAMSNAKRGIVSYLTEGPETAERFRVLNVVEGLPPMSASFRCLPKRSFARVRKQVETGDLILFVSTKKCLDVFHTGILAVKDGQTFLRHATRAAGRVVEQPLIEFLNNHRMSGFILLRPLCQH